MKFVDVASVGDRLYSKTGPSSSVGSSYKKCHRQSHYINMSSTSIIIYGLVAMCHGIIDAENGDEGGFGSVTHLSRRRSS